MEDTFKHRGLRRRLVQELKEKGITDQAVLNAIEEIPRHFFVDSTFLRQAYEDRAFPIGAAQTISMPFTVAWQSSLLMIEKGTKVLEIGTGSGYQTAVLLALGAKVFTIERQKMLFDKTKRLLPQMKYRPKFFYGDGYKGIPTFGPYDRIIVTCGAPYIPEELKKQLMIGGHMVIPVGGDAGQIMTVVERLSESEFEAHEVGDCAFVPMLSKRNKAT